MNMQLRWFYIWLGWKDLSNCITDDTITRNKNILGRIQFIFAFFIIFPLFPEIFISIDEYEN